ncbi:hypothetical protein [Parapedobacter soli]|uniref:hypothetical protein n=1 Tax=Parapedobacter soli TaxID=416955 RepID=UPI0021C6837E|nr:hypothetical protein [Parapedobacter soli]
MSIFTAALPKKPSVTDKDLILRSRPWLKACLMPDAASLELTDDELELLLEEVADPEVPLPGNWLSVSHWVKNSKQDARENSFNVFMG